MDFWETLWVPGNFLSDWGVMLIELEILRAETLRIGF